MGRRAYRIDLLAVDGFIPIEVGTVLDVLRIAERHEPNTRVDLRVVSVEHASKVSSIDGRMQLALEAPRPVGAADMAPELLIVAGGRGIADYAPQIMLMVSKALTRDCDVLLLSDAAKAWVRVTRGEKPASVHWEDRIALLERFDAEGLSAAISSRDGRLVTSAGMAATVDTMLEMIARHRSDLLARQVGRSLVVDRIRAGDTPQAGCLSDLPGYENEIVRRVIEHMEHQMEEPISAKDLADAAGVSIRQIERLFRAHLGQPPMRFLRDLRLTRARYLVESTNLPMIEISLACGLGHPTRLAKAFRRHLGMSPHHYRKTLSRRAAGR